MIKFCRDFKKYFSYTLYAAWAELKSEITESYLSWILLILEPFCFMLIYTFIVRIVFHSSEAYLPVFVFIGITIWNFFSKTVNGSVKLIKSNKSIISRIYIPKFVLLNISILINFYKMLVSLVIVACMLIFYGIELSIYALYLLPLIILLLCGTFACSVILMHFGVFVKDLSNVINIVLRLTFYLSGVFYSLSTRVPRPYGAYLTHYNPIAYIIDEMRNILIFAQPLNLKWYISWMVVSIVFSFIGISTIYKHESKYAKVI